MSIRTYACITVDGDAWFHAGLYIHSPRVRNLGGCLVRASVLKVYTMYRSAIEDWIIRGTPIPERAYVWASHGEPTSGYGFTAELDALLALRDGEITVSETEDKYRIGVRQA